MGVLASFRLGDWRVETAANLLKRGEEEIRLELKLIEVLACLAAHAGEVVSKRELIDEVWQTEFVAENTLTHAIASLRRVLGDDARNPSYIETIPKRGYRLRATVARDSDPPVAAPPPFLTDEFEEPVRPTFVAREVELAQLDTLLDGALEGTGTVAFVTGEAGSGKTALVGEFLRRVQDRVDDLVVAAGASNAATGTGDPYGPWRQVLSQLSGDVENLVARGTLSAIAGRRLWEGLPVFAEAVLASGRDLVGTLVPGGALASHAASAASGAPWLDDLAELAARKTAEPTDATRQQAAVFLQIVRVLQATTRKRPLVLVLDDLQWADTATLGLLCDLGRQVDGARLMVVGAFRPEDVAMGRDGETHPLVPVINEIKRVHGDVEIAVGAIGEREFVDALLDDEANRLDAGFRNELFAHTRGHALFSVELLRMLQDRAMLVRDGEGRWIAPADLDWSHLPGRVEGVIGARIERLADDLKELLRIASVEGEGFTAEVLARVRDVDTRGTIQLLSRELERRHRLVNALGIRALTTGRLSLFGFSHVLFQRYLYTNLNHAERAQMHEDVGRVLEALYGDECADVATQLARHFEEAGIVDQAIHYLIRAANLAVRTTANTEAVHHLRRALELLATLPESDRRDELELSIQLAMQTPLAAILGWGAEEVGRAAARALELSERVANDQLVNAALWYLSTYHSCRAEYRLGSRISRRFIELAQARDDELQLALASWCVGFGYQMGELEQGRMHLERAADYFCEKRHDSLRFVYGVEPAVACLSHLSHVLLALGYPDAAARRLEQAQVIAEHIDHPISESLIPWFGSGLASNLGDLPTLKRHIDRLLAISTTHCMPVQLIMAQALDAAVRAAEGDPLDDNGQCPELLTRLRMTGFQMGFSGMLRVLAVEKAALGQLTEALAAYDAALEFIEEHDERVYESPVLTERGQLLLAMGQLDAAQSSFNRALEVARAQRARMWELFAATALARVWQGQGRKAEARELLQPIYDWFSEGRDTPPLQHARALLDELAGQNE